MKWNIEVKALKNLGYQFCKLYANNNKFYYKTIDGFKIWLRVNGRHIEIDDIDEKIVNFFNENYEAIENKNEDDKSSLDNWLVMKINKKTGEILLCNGKYNIKPVLDNSRWTQKIIPIESFKKVLKEIKKLHD